MILNLLGADLLVWKRFGLTLFVICLGCRCDYNVNREYIEAECEIDHGLKISKITVDSVNGDGVPVVFNVDSIVICSFKGNQGAGDQSFVAKRKILLQEPNESYDWFFFQPYDPGHRFKIFPLRFVPRSWYLLVSLESSNEKEYFIYVDDRGLLSEYVRFIPGPF